MRVHRAHNPSKRAHVAHWGGHRVEAGEAERRRKVRSHAVVFQNAFDGALCIGSRRHCATDAVARRGEPPVVEARVVVALAVHLEHVAIIRLPKQPVRRHGVVVDGIGGLDLKVHPQLPRVRQAHGG
eukprot:5162043-Prymnesium_polylepis.1